MAGDRSTPTIQPLHGRNGKAHVQAALAAAGLKPISLDFASTRAEKGVPVPGLIVVAGGA